jgi:hypothetical protein
MSYIYDKSPGGDKLSVTGCEQHGGIIMTAHAASGKTAVPVCIPAEHVPEVMREMAAWAGLRYLAQEI